METPDSAFLILCVCSWWPEGQVCSSSLAFIGGNLHGHGRACAGLVVFYIDTISMETEMFTFLVIYNFLPTLSEVN